jgi:hypothetical protein
LNCTNESYELLKKDLQKLDFYQEELEQISKKVNKFRIESVFEEFKNKGISVAGGVLYTGLEMVLTGGLILTLPYLQSIVVYQFMMKLKKINKKIYQKQI